MTKGENGVYTGVLTLLKGTRFAVKILKSTVDGTSGGDDVWSAVRYTSVLNSDGRYDFGEFVDNLVPNGNFEEGVDTQSIMFEYTHMMVNGKQWTPFSGKFKSGDLPVKAQVVCEARNGQFDDISIISAP